MKKVFTGLTLPAFVLAAGMAPALAQAALADLSTFSAISGADGSHSVSANMASIGGVAALSGRVTGLSSFEWQFTDSSNLDGFSSFSLTPLGSPTSIVNLAADSTVGFQTYSFATPFSGVIRFAVDSHDVNTQATLELRNVMVSAVPEPETYAMLLAGLGLLGLVARRKTGGAGRMSAQDGQSRKT